MSKKATTIQQQIQKLQERGMEFGTKIEKEKAEEQLLDIGYYRLGFYWHYFEIDKDNKNHNFKENTLFSDVVKLYYLDVDLKFMLMRALNRIEINIRTQVTYFVSNYYKESPTWFADKNIMQKNFVDNLGYYYNDNFKKNNKVIKIHHQEYINDLYAPAWKTLEFFTFRQILKIYCSLKNADLQKEIASKYGIKKVNIFENYFRTMVFIRNICAHSGVLYDSKTPLYDSKTPKEIKPSALIFIHNNNTHYLDTSIKVILHFLGIISKNRKDELQKNIENLFKENAENKSIKKIIQEKIGYKFDL